MKANPTPFHASVPRLPDEIARVKRLNIEIPIDLRRRLKRKALEKETTVTSIVLALISEYLEGGDEH